MSARPYLSDWANWVTLAIGDGLLVVLDGYFDETGVTSPVTCVGGYL